MWSNHLSLSYCTQSYVSADNPSSETFARPIPSPPRFSAPVPRLTLIQLQRNEVSAQKGFCWTVMDSFTWHSSKHLDKHCTSLQSLCHFLHPWDLAAPPRVLCIFPLWAPSGSFFFLVLRKGLTLEESFFRPCFHNAGADRPAETIHNSD